MIARPKHLETPTRTRSILLTVFLFLYLPIAYYWGPIVMRGIAFDFPSFYHAARLAFVRGESPYGLRAFDLPWVQMGRKINPYLYPPPSLLAFWPLAYLSIGHAQAAFLIVSHLCLLGCVWLILFRLTPLPAEQGLREIILGVCLVYILMSDSVLKTLALGQVNCIALLFLCLALAALRLDSSAWRIALPLSIAILLKTYPALLLIPMLFRRQFRAAALTCMFFGAWTLAAMAALPSSVWSTWFYEVLPLGGYGNNAISAAFVWNQSINAFVTRLLVPSEFAEAPLLFPALANPIATAFAAFVFGVTVFFSFSASRRPDYRAHSNDELAAFLLMIFLIAPISWDHHLVYILPAATVAISLLASGSSGGKPAIAVAGALFVMAWNVPIDHPAFQHGWWTLLMSMKLYSVTVLWLFFLYRLRQPLLLRQAQNLGGDFQKC